MNDEGIYVAKGTTDSILSSLEALRGAKCGVVVYVVEP